MKNIQYDPAKLVGWKPPRWTHAHKNETRTWRGHGRKTRGPAHTPSPASLCRKARSLAGRKA